jgi:hypothetical protein
VDLVSKALIDSDNILAVIVELSVILNVFGSACGIGRKFSEDIVQIRLGINAVASWTDSAG